MPKLIWASVLTCSADQKLNQIKRVTSEMNGGHETKAKKWETKITKLLGRNFHSNF